MARSETVYWRRWRNGDLLANSSIRPMPTGPNQPVRFHGERDVDRRESDLDQRTAGSVAAALLAVQNGASLVRVHDVRETVDAIKVWMEL